MMGKLQGKVAIITGATEGIGLATARLFVREGAYVFITGRRQKELDEAVKTIGSNATGVQGDVSNLADLDRLYKEVGKVKGRVDIIFANAGVGEFVPVGKVSEEHFDKIFNVNVKGALFTVQKGLPLLNDGGSIILTGSGKRKRHSCLWRLCSQQGGDSLFRAHLDRGSQRSSYPVECCQPGSDQYAADKPAIRRCNCADCLNCADGTHW
jgi:NAD(P)-dependent dehydrogenase (short-subunit alcohol dehydrogenase family)